MQRCAASIISAPHVHSLLPKVVYRDRLITLGGHMKHVNTEFVLYVDISASLHKELAGVRITLKRGKVQGNETIGIVFQVDPGFKTLVIPGQLSLGKAEDSL